LSEGSLPAWRGTSQQHTGHVTHNTRGGVYSATQCCRHERFQQNQCIHAQEPQQDKVMPASQLLQPSKDVFLTLAANVTLTFIMNSLSEGSLPRGVEEAKGSSLCVLLLMSKRRVRALAKGW
jgi:hypothetical protein